MRITGSYRDIWNLAWPIMLGSLGNTVINFTDVAFVGRLGEPELAASALGGVFYMLLVMIGVALGTGSQIMIARREGEGATDRVAEVVVVSFKLLVAFGIAMSATLLTVVPQFLDLIVNDSHISQLTATYLKARSWGLVPMLIMVLVRCFYTGIADTRIITYTTLVMVVLNVILNYVFVFGAMGVEPMGIAGSGFASACSETIAAIFAIAYTIAKGTSARYGIFNSWHSSVRLYRQLMTLSAPMILQHFLSMGAWFLFFILIEKLGSRELAVSNVVRSVYMVLMTPVWGIAQATSSMVSNVIGQGRSDEVMRLITRISKFSFASCLLVISLCLLFMNPLLGLCTSDADIVSASQNPFLIVCLATLFFGPAMVFMMAVSGTGMTIASMRIEIVSLFVYIVYLVAVTLVFPSAVAVVWVSEILYWCFMGTLSLLYLRSGKWKLKVL
jgi:putative MATE family efflux protein